MKEFQAIEVWNVVLDSKPSRNALNVLAGSHLPTDLYYFSEGKMVKEERLILVAAAFLEEWADALRESISE